MSNSATPESAESFEDILTQYEKAHKPEDGSKQIEATVVALTVDSVLLDIGFKSEGILPLTALNGEEVKPGDKLTVSVQGRDPEGYYTLTRFKVERPKDWTALEKAFAEKSTIVGTVTGAIKGGLSVDIGVRAFMPISRSGARDAAEVANLVGQEIRCRIMELDVADENVVVDRRAVTEEEEKVVKERRYNELKEGDTVTGTVRSLADYGAFIDLGGVDGLLHVGEISWSRVNKPADVLTVGDHITAKVLKVDPDKRRISLGMKQLQPHPWDAVPGKYSIGDRVTGTVSRIMEFGAFVELEPGIEGLIHISEMSWGKKLRIASDIVKPNETVDVIILGINPAERRIALGLKQALGDPWSEVPNKFPVGSVVEGPVTKIMKFGAFIQLEEGIDGMVHVSDISAERRIDSPHDVLRVGQTVKAQVLAIDKEKRQLKLGMKQLVPTGLDEYIVEHKAGDVVTGRLMEIKGSQARAELGEGIYANCRITAEKAPEESKQEAKADLSSLTSMLQARWKGGATAATSKPEPVTAGQVRSFRITSVDASTKKIEVELA
ncbi:MAG TPA: S1 RNA-binding domain-containing protein [Terriglobales bacterium]|nr:S1 RNA-binding domain-containing protein [Terriglobales bacterium]